MSAGAGRVTAAVTAVAVLAVAGWFTSVRYRNTVAADAALSALSSPYRTTGWRPFVRPLWAPRDRLELTVDAGTCVVALVTGIAPGGKLTIRRPGGTFEAVSSAGYCTCADEKTFVRSVDPRGEVLVLTQDASAVGGSAALGFQKPKPATLRVGEACRVDALDTWIAAGHGVSPLDASALATTVRDAIVASGFTLVASAPAAAPFAVVPPAADACFLATSSTSGEALDLRVAGGEHPLHVAPGTALGIAWCTETAVPVTVSREGTGTVVVYKADAGRAVGTAGLREVAGRAGLGDVPIWVKPTEGGWDASAPLMAAGVLAKDITYPDDATAVPQGRAVSLTLGSASVAPTPNDPDKYACIPGLETNPRDALCVQSAPLRWSSKGGVRVGVAASPLPFWMDIMTHVEDRHGLAAELQLLTLSRKLRAQHYDATARADVIEEPTGIVVTGRAGDDRVIAVGLLSAAPWVLPYTDGEAWSLDSGEPRSIALAVGEAVHLVSLPPERVPPEVRRTVVFRHRLDAAEKAK